MAPPDAEPEQTAAALNAERIAASQQPGLRAIVYNTAWLVGDRLVGLALTGVLTIAVVRYLRAQEFGLLSYAAAVVGLFTPLIQFGLDSIVVRDLVREPEARPEILGSASVVMLASALVLTPAMMVWVHLSAPGAQSTTLITILSAQYIFQALLVIDFAFRSVLQSKYSTISSKVGLAANAILSVVLIERRAGVAMFACAMLLETVVTGIALMLSYHYLARTTDARWYFRAARARAMVAAGLPLLIGSIAGSVYLRVDLVLLRSLAGERETGLFAVVTRLTELWYFVPSAIIISVFPTLLRGHDDPAQHKRRIQALYDLMAVFGYAVAIPTTFIATPLVTLLFGADFTAAGRLLAVHIWTLLLISIGIARNNWLVAEGLGRYYMWAGIGGAIINVAIDWIFIPHYGAMAAAWASIAAQAFIVIGSSAMAPRLWPSIRQTLLALAVPFRWRAVKQSVQEALGGTL